MEMPATFLGIRIKSHLRGSSSVFNLVCAIALNIVSRGADSSLGSCFCRAETISFFRCSIVSHAVWTWLLASAFDVQVTYRKTQHVGLFEFKFWDRFYIYGAVQQSAGVAVSSPR